MSSKVSQLVRKLALKSIFAEKEGTVLHQKEQDPFVAHKEKLDKLGYETVRKLQAIINEMEGDLFSLKQKGFPKKEWVEFTKVYQDLIVLRKWLRLSTPFENAQAINSTLNDRMFRARVDTLDIIIQHFLEKNQVEGITGPTLMQTRVDSLKKILDFADEIQRFLKEHFPKPISTVPPPPEEKQERIIMDTVMPPAMKDKL